MQLVKITEKEFDVVYKEMENNFVLDERRDYIDNKNLLNNEKYHIYLAVESGINVGFITVWELSKYLFVEHFVIFSSFRNKGFGNSVLTELKNFQKPIILEVEHPESDLKARRINFYKRNGFFENEVEYFQPSYRKGGDSVPLILMTTGAPLDNPKPLIDEIYKTVYFI